MKWIMFVEVVPDGEFPQGPGGENTIWYHGKGGASRSNLKDIEGWAMKNGWDRECYATRKCNGVLRQNLYPCPVHYSVGKFGFPIDND